MNEEQFSTAMTPLGEPLGEGGLPAHYEWTASGGVPRVKLSFDVIDQLNFEVMRGFGAVPRRGAEVGGVLIGHVSDGGNVVTVTSFQPLPCRHARGPSYILDEAELENLAEALAKLEPGLGREDWAVGFYRSNTREALELSEEDQALLERFFPAEPGVCLMVRPFATRVSEAVFFYSREGVWRTDGAESVFPFRRKDLGGGSRPKRPRMEVEPVERHEPAAPQAMTQHPAGPAPTIIELPPVSRPLMPAARQVAAAAGGAQEEVRIPIPDVPEFAESRPSRVRGTWVWIPLSFVFLLLGIVLGFQIALSVSRSQKEALKQPDPYALELTAVEFGESLHLKWNSRLPAFVNATKATLHIQDGNNTKTVEITRDDIARGGILYKNATSEVHFRLEVPQGERVSVSESVDLRLLQENGSRR